MENKEGKNWLDLFISLIRWLRENNIRPVFVFDGTRPIQKIATSDARRNAMKISEQKMDAIATRLEGTTITETERADLEREYAVMSSRCIKVEKWHIDCLKKVLTFMGLPWLQAVGEAEKSCVWLCKWGYVKGVVSADTDSLAYGCPVFIRDIKVGHEFCEVIHHSAVLDSLEWTAEQFLDFCILCGTDYNKNIKGIGPKGAFKLIDEYVSLDNVDRDILDGLDYPVVRGLFKLPANEEPDRVFSGDFCGVPHLQAQNDERLDAILREYGCRFTAERIRDGIYKPQFIILPLPEPMY